MAATDDSSSLALDPARSKSDEVVTSTAAPPPNPSPAVKPKAARNRGVPRGTHLHQLTGDLHHLADTEPRLRHRLVLAACHVEQPPMYVATPGFYRLHPPAIFVPKYLMELSYGEFIGCIANVVSCSDVCHLSLLLASHALIFFGVL